MADSSLNHYEKRLYSVFKTFDVDNEEALTRGAVLALCDALQLEQRGAGLVEALFEQRPTDDHPELPDRTEQRVTFAQFRSGLLSVLGEPPSPAPASASVTATGPHVAKPASSDEDPLGREVAPKFVFGSKKYGRRSRPSASRGRAPSPSRVASASPPLSPSPPSPELDHSSVVDCESALQLCRRLRMAGIGRDQVQRVFDGLPAAETTVGDFFDRLNAALTVSMGDAGAGAGAGPGDDALSAELVVEAWERAGVARPRRLLVQLGGAGATVGGGRLARALGDELSALGEAGGGGGGARAELLQAALALARLQLERAGAGAAAAAAERDRLRADLEEANRRARLLALDVDENYARLEADSAAALRRADARHADALRTLEAERAAERERAAIERARLDAELARRADAELAARSELDALRARCEQAEACAARAAEGGAAAERERARAEDALRAAEERAAAADAALEGERAAGAARAEGLRAEAARQRDRADELAAQLEARPPPARPAPPPPAPAWLLEAGTAHALETESPPVSLEAGEGPGAEVLAAEGDGKAGAGEGEADAEADACPRGECAELRHLVRELEGSLELLRDEYERCEEYWAGKLAAERAALAAEQRAADQRLGQLVAKVQEYERQFEPRARLPAIAEAPALEQHAADLDAAAADLQRRDADLQRRDAELAARNAELAARDAALATREEAARRHHAAARRRGDELRAHEQHLARLAHSLAALRQRAPKCKCGGVGGGGGGGGVEAELRLRAARAEAGAARLAARLAAADRLVKDLYVENCHLAPPTPLASLAPHAAPL